MAEKKKQLNNRFSNFSLKNVLKTAVTVPAAVPIVANVNNGNIFFSNFYSFVEFNITVNFEKIGQKLKKRQLHAVHKIPSNILMKLVNYSRAFIFQSVFKNV